jgi:hypothetical protein
MKQVKRTYTDFNEFVKNEPELIETLIQMTNENAFPPPAFATCEGIYSATELVTWNYKDQKYEPMTKLSDIIGLIQEWGDFDESISSLYVNRTYSMETDDGKFSLEAYGSSYRKDQSICDERMGNEIVVIDNIALEIQAEHEKLIKAEKKKAENTKKWKDFVSDKTDVEIIYDLMNNYTFPSKIK